jgi:hypothetical protein
VVADAAGALPLREPIAERRAASELLRMPEDPWGAD